MVEDLLPFALRVGHQSAGIVFSAAKRGWDCDSSHLRRAKAPLRSGSRSTRHTLVAIESLLLGDFVLHAHDSGLCNVDDGPSSNSYKKVGRSLACGLGDRDHAGAGRMLWDAIECSRVPVPQGLADPLYLIGGRIQRPASD